MKFPISLNFLVCCLVFLLVNGQRERDWSPNPTTFNIGGVLSSNDSKALFKETIDVSQNWSVIGYCKFLFVIELIIIIICKWQWCRRMFDYFVFVFLCHIWEGLAFFYCYIRSVHRFFAKVFFSFSTSSPPKLGLWRIGLLKIVKV